MSKESNPPLQRHPYFVASNAQDMAKEFETKVAARIVSLSADAYSLAHRRILPSGGQLWYGLYRGEITLRFWETDFTRIQIQRAGSGLTTIGRSAVEVTAGQTCISPSDVTTAYGRGFSQFVWRVPNQVLTRKLVAITGEPIPRKLSFEPVFDRSTSHGRIFESVLTSLLTSIDHAQSESQDFLVAELESALIGTLLLNGAHNMAHLLAKPPSAAAPWQVRRVEEYLNAHWKQPFDIESIVAETGLSGRSIYRAFRRWRGYSPNEFARRQRLEHARKLLIAPGFSRTVTAVAFECGFNDVSHFSREFSKAFGQSPSEASSRRCRNGL